MSTEPIGETDSPTLPEQGDATPETPVVTLPSLTRMQDLVEGLPASVVKRIEMQPAVDLMLRVLRDQLPDVTFMSAIPNDQSSYPDGSAFPDIWVLVHKVSVMGEWGGDERFVNQASVEVQVFTKNPDGELKGELVSEAIRNSLRDAQNEHKLYPGLGSLVKVHLAVEPTRQTDWATSTGPVQFADLPGDYSRVVARYDIKIRRDVWNTHP